MRTTQRTAHRTIAIAIGALALTGLGLTGCAAGAGAASEPSSNQSQAAAPPTASGGMDAASGLVGPGCADYAKQVPSGPGSVEGMSAAPVATAASNNPLLTTLVAAVSGKLNPQVNLVDTLNSGQYTVFAPVDSAFEKLDPATIEALKQPSGSDTLTKVLTYHVISGQLTPSEIDGTHKTVEGEDVTVTGSGDDLMVNDSAKVICGGVQTANATVYLIDSVLMPPSM